jgi:hypothetical protein
LTSTLDARTPAVFGFMNTAANVASAVSSLVFGYMVGYSGNLQHAVHLHVRPNDSSDVTRVLLTNAIPGARDQR